jgi:4-hydroxy-3-methylbut-2-enyl diphosphate reductase
MMQIVIDEKAGPCGGVKRVIKLAEQKLAAGEKIASRGEVIHNSVEISRLEKLGLKTAPEDSIKHTDDTGQPHKLLIRAHGATPAVFQQADREGVEVIDGTCPVVTRSQKLARKYHEQGYQVVVVGKPKHPEVIAIVGHCDNQARVVHQEADIARLDADRPTFVLAQTTIDEAYFNKMLAAIERHVHTVEQRNTICAFVSNRKEQLRAFAAECDVILLVGGKNSSNTRVMFDDCHAVNPRSYWIETAADIEPGWLKDDDTVGISGSASTPGWLLEQIAAELRRRFMH